MKLDIDKLPRAPCGARNGPGDDAMSIETLREQVTRAILQAEALDATGPQFAVKQAYWTVSTIEAEIAEMRPADGEEGAIARRGAVRALLAAGLPVHAKELADRYMAESNAPTELKRELSEMVANVESNLGPIPVISAARYQFHDEAA